MMSEPAAKRADFSARAFLCASAVLSLICFIRATRGLDLTDEMQYYGEIGGLVETGRLFSNDLFVQQSVYILLYPIFRLHHLLFGLDGLVFFGRLVMSILTAGVFAYAYQKLRALEFSESIASLTALSLTFAIPYHGVFAPSYNTISQMLWLIFALGFFEWKQSGPLWWGVLPVITAFAHPISAVTMTLLIFARLLSERDFARMGKLALVLLGGAFIAVLMALLFALPQEYWASLVFSSGYGVGAAFFSSMGQPLALVAMCAMFAICVLVCKGSGNSHVAISTAVFLTVAITLFWGAVAQYGYSLWIASILSFLTALAYGWALSGAPISDTRSRQRIHWLAILILVLATALGVTSGNGISQSTGAFMLGLPLFMGIAATRGSRARMGGSFLPIGFICVALVFILFTAHWSRFPYREDNWWRTNTPVESVAAFRFIDTSSERAAFIRVARQALGNAVQGKRALIVGEYPALYFALDAIPETCMLYMHSITSGASGKTLLECLDGKLPEVAVDILSREGAPEAMGMKYLMRSHLSAKGYACEAGSMRFNSTGIYNPAQLNVSICRPP